MHTPLLQQKLGSYTAKITYLVEDREPGGIWNQEGDENTGLARYAQELLEPIAQELTGKEKGEPREYLQEIRMKATCVRHNVCQDCGCVPMSDMC